MTLSIVPTDRYEAPEDNGWVRVSVSMLRMMLQQMYRDTPVSIEWGEPDLEGRYEPIIRTHYNLDHVLDIAVPPHFRRRP